MEVGEVEGREAIYTQPPAPPLFPGETHEPGNFDGVAEGHVARVGAHPLACPVLEALFASGSIPLPELRSKLSHMRFMHACMRLLACFHA
jgi:hypothetical protein